MAQPCRSIWQAPTPAFALLELFDHVAVGPTLVQQVMEFGTVDSGFSTLQDPHIAGLRRRLGLLLLTASDQLLLAILHGGRRLRRRTKLFFFRFQRELGTECLEICQQLWCQWHRRVLAELLLCWHGQRAICSQTQLRQGCGQELTHCFFEMPEAICGGGG